MANRKLIDKALNFIAKRYLRTTQAVSVAVTVTNENTNPTPLATIRIPANGRYVVFYNIISERSDNTAQIIGQIDWNNYASNITKRFGGAAVRVSALNGGGASGNVYVETENAEGSITLTGYLRQSTASSLTIRTRVFIVPVFSWGGEIQT